MTEENKYDASTAGSGGKGLAIFALLVGLAAAGGGGYLWYQMEQDKKVRQTASEELDARLEKAIQTVAEQQEADLNSLKAQVDQQQDRLQELAGATQTNNINVEALQDRSQVLEGGIQSLQGEIQVLNSALDLQKGSIEIQKTETSNLQSEVRNAQSSIQSLQDEVQSVRTGLEERRAADRTRQAELQALQSETRVLQEGATALKDGIQTAADELDTKIQTLANDLATQTDAGSRRQTEIQALQDETQALTGNLLALQDQVSKQAGEQQNAVAEINSRIDNLQIGQRGLLNTLEAVKEVAARGGDVNAFALSEVEYLMRMADHKLDFGQDVENALQALQIAGERLAAINENAFSAVKRMLDENIASLRAVEVANIADLVAQVTELERSIDGLPLRVDIQMDTLKEKVKPPLAKGEEAPEDTGWLDQFTTAAWGELKDIIVIRNERTSGPPLIAVEEEYFLVQNLHLEMEAVRLALIRGDAAAYQNSLSKAKTWVETYFDADKAPVIAFLDELGKLQAVQLNPYVPNISDTLRAFQDVMARREPIRSVAAPALVEEQPAATAPTEEAQQ